MPKKNTFMPKLLTYFLKNKLYKRYNNKLRRHNG